MGEGLARALYRLLYHRSYREAFLRGEAAGLGLSAAEQEALAPLDREQLVEAAGLILERVLRGPPHGSGGLLAAYPRALEAWRRAGGPGDLLALCAGFLESEAFSRVRELPYAEQGISIEEAFYLFLRERPPFSTDPDLAAALEAELLEALFRLLLLSPSLRVERLSLRRLPRGCFTIAWRGGEPVLYAIAAGRFLKGAVTPLIVELLRREAEGEAGGDEALAARFGASPGELDATRRRLRELGLLG